MKTHTYIQGITQEDLVNLFSCALYGNEYMDADYLSSFYEKNCKVDN